MIVQLKKIYHQIVPNYLNFLKKQTQGYQSILDLGCGPNSIVQHLNIPRKVGVELFEPYLQESIKKSIHSEYIQADIRTLDITDKSFDIVYMSEVLEHLSKQEGAELLAKMSRWAKHKVIITTPNGFIEQGEVDSNKLQEHRSGWTVKDLGQNGFKVYGMAGMKSLRGYRSTIKYKPEIFWNHISAMSEFFVFKIPNAAFQLIGIKYIS